MHISQLFRYLAGAIDRVNRAAGVVSSWLVVGLVGLTLYDVVMRYLFRSGSVAAQELEWHFFSIIFLLGAGYTLKSDGHVRVDLLYASKRFSDRQRAVVDLLGHIFFLIPFAALIIWSAVPFAVDAFTRAEMSPDPGGLPWRWIIKAVIPLGFTLLLLTEDKEL